MPRKRTLSPQSYRLLESSNVSATTVQVVETGTVRMGLLLEVISEALHEYPDAKLAISETIAKRLGTDPETRILP